MANFANRARQSTATTGTGTLTLGAAVAGFQTMVAAGIYDGEMVSYCIEEGTNWEVGRGYTGSTGTTFVRDTILQSSNAGAAISLAGAAQIFITALEPDLRAGSIGRTIASSNWQAMP